MIEVVITGGGSGLADEILEALAPIEADFRVRLIDTLDAAGEARRFQGRTVLVELDTEAGLDSADVVLDLDASYAGQIDRFRPEPPAVALLRRLFAELPSGHIDAMHGVIREPAVSMANGVEALAAQVTQLFNGRDPEHGLFGGTLAFNSRILDEASVCEALATIPALDQANVSIERVLSDSFYTVVASLWVQSSADAAILSLTNTAFVAGEGVSPDSGRVDVDAPIRLTARSASAGWVHLHVSADLERTLWAQDARDAVLRRLDRVL